MRECAFTKKEAHMGDGDVLRSTAGRKEGEPGEEEELGRLTAEEGMSDMESRSEFLTSLLMELCRGEGGKGEGKHGSVSDCKVRTAVVK